MENQSICGIIDANYSLPRFSTMMEPSCFMTGHMGTLSMSFFDLYSLSISHCILFGIPMMMVCL